MKNLNRRTLLANALPATLATGLAGAAQTDASPPPVDAVKLGELIAAYDQAVARVYELRGGCPDDVMDVATRAESKTIGDLITAIRPARVLIFRGRVFTFHSESWGDRYPSLRPRRNYGYGGFLIHADPAEVLVVS